MFCPDCGASAPDNAMFCPNCGYNLEKVRAQDPASSAPTSNPQSFQKAHYLQQTKIPDENYYTGGDLPPRRAGDKQEDSFPVFYYILSIIMWPMGIVFWALHRDSKPSAAKKTLFAGIFGFVLFIFLLG